MHVPALQGVIKRRVLVNYRVRPEIARSIVPEPLELDLHGGWAHAGICLIRLEQIRPSCSPVEFGLHSENAAHRYAVRPRADGPELGGVFVTRRDTDNVLNHLAGGRVFPGLHGRARFKVDDGLDESGHCRLEIEGEDLGVLVDGHASEAWPRDSVFADLAEASAFYARGVRGWSPASDGGLEALDLCVPDWRCTPFSVDELRSSHFDDLDRFPPGSVEFDHALLMRDIAHSWHAVPR